MALGYFLEKGKLYNTMSNCIPYSAYISRVFNFANFANLEPFAKLIQLKFEPLGCHAHGQHALAKFFQRIPSKQQFAKILTHEI